MSLVKNFTLQPLILCQHSHKEREIEKYVKPIRRTQKEEPEPQPEETPAQGIQLIGLKSSHLPSSSS